MLYSYRHPDHIAGASAQPKVSTPSEHEVVNLEERRRIVRAIPVAAVIESDDAEAWDLWTQATQGTSA